MKRTDRKPSLKLHLRRSIVRALTDVELEAVPGGRQMQMPIGDSVLTGPDGGC
jgi:hypothetical protein